MAKQVYPPWFGLLTDQSRTMALFDLSACSQSSCVSRSTNQNNLIIITITIIVIIRIVTRLFINLLILSIFDAVKRWSNKQRHAALSCFCLFCFGAENNVILIWQHLAWRSLQRNTKDSTSALRNYDGMEKYCIMHNIMELWSDRIL